MGHVTEAMAGQGAPNFVPPSFGEDNGHKCLRGVAQPGSPQKEWGAGGHKATPWSLGASTWTRPQHSATAFQREQQRNFRKSHSAFDESPNGTSLPLTYAPGPCVKRQFSNQCFEASTNAPPSQPNDLSLSTPSLAKTTLVTAPYGTDLDERQNLQRVSHSVPPQGWQGSYDSCLHNRRLTNPGAKMPGAFVEEGQSVHELISPFEPVEKPEKQPSNAIYGGQVQDWQGSMDSNLSSRRQLRAQGPN